MVPGLLGGVGEPRQTSGWNHLLGNAYFHLPLPFAVFTPPPMFVGLLVLPCVCESAGREEPRPVKSKVQVAAAVVTCLVGIPCSSSYAAVLAGLPPCLTPLAALAALPR